MGARLAEIHPKLRELKVYEILKFWSKYKAKTEYRFIYHQHRWPLENRIIDSGWAKKTPTASDRGATPVGQESDRRHTIRSDEVSDVSISSQTTWQGESNTRLQRVEQTYYLQSLQNGRTSTYATHETQDDWLIKVDLKHVYLHLPLHTQHRPLVAFKWWEKTYQFLALPFGIAHAPRLFTKVMKPVLQTSYQQGIRLSFLSRLISVWWPGQKTKHFDIGRFWSDTYWI
jgi:hypothetical protein